MAAPVRDLTPIGYNTDVKKQPNEKQPLVDTSSPWGLSFYWGRMSTKLLNQVLQFNIDTHEAVLYSAEISYQLAPENIISRASRYVGAKFSVALNGTYQDDPQGNIYEVNTFFRLDWSNVPWKKYLLTTFSIGEGVSYVSDVPARELRTAWHDKDAKRFNNFLMFEMAFALPSHPNIQILYRVHHRSGCFGLYHSSNSGSTAIGVGIRYLF